MAVTGKKSTVIGTLMYYQEMPSALMWILCHWPQLRYDAKHLSMRTVVLLDRNSSNVVEGKRVSCSSGQG